MQNQEEFALANFFRTTPGFSTIYRAGERTGQAVYGAGQVTSQATGIRPEIPVVSESPRGPIEEQRRTYAIYQRGRQVSDWLAENIEAPYERGASRLGYGIAGEFLGGLVSSPRLVVEMGSMIPAGAVRLAKEMSRNPASFLGYATAGLVLQGKSIAEGIEKKPARFAGEMIGTIAITAGIARGTRIGYEAISPRLTEASILLRTSPKSWRATHATVNLYKDVYKIESRLRAEPNLGLVKNIGPGKEQAITEYISSQKHTIFGRTTEIGQMPRAMFEARGGTKDIDIFTRDVKGFQAGSVRTLGKSYIEEGNLVVKKAGGTALDIHPFPEKYPVGKAIPQEVAYDVAKPALNPLPKFKADILFGKKLVQEKLYIQAQRKATSTIGETTGFVKFRQGPQLHRLKDVYDLMRTSSYLGTELEAKTASMVKVDPRYLIGKFKTQRIKSSIESLQRFYGAPENVGQYKGAGELSKAIKQFKYGETPQARLPSGTERELIFKPPKGYVHPTQAKSPSISMVPTSTFASVSRAASASVSIKPSVRASPLKSVSSISIASISRSISKSGYAPKSRSISSLYKSPSISPSKSPPYKSPSISPSKSPPYKSPSIPPSLPLSSVPPTLTFKVPRSTAWWPEKKKQPFIRKASVKDIGWKITNPVPTLKGFGLGKKRHKK